MKYQLAFFDRSGECWRFRRANFEIISFDTLEDAETAAKQLSVENPRCEVLVLTLHLCFKTEEEERPRPEPIRHTRQIAILTTSVVKAETKQ